MFKFSRFPLGRLRSSISSGKQIPLKSHCLSAETEKQPETEAPDYLPLVSCADKQTQHMHTNAQRHAKIFINMCLCGVSSGAPTAGIRSFSSDGAVFRLCPDPPGPPKKGFTLQPPPPQPQPTFPLHISQCSIFIHLCQASGCSL